MKLVGIGMGGCNIAKKIHEYNKKADLITFDEKNATYLTPPEKKAEKIEEKFVAPKFAEDGDSVYIFVCGSGKTPFIILKLLESLQTCKVVVTYIKPSYKTLNKEQKNNEKVLRGVLRDYCLSAKFKLILFDNQNITEKVGTAPILSFYSKINEFIGWTLTTFEFLKGQDPVLGKYLEPPEHSMITSLSLKRSLDHDFIDGFNIENPRGRNFLFAVEKKALQEDESLLQYIETEMTKKETEYSKNNYLILESETEENFCIIETYTNYI
tara:strand:+ start:1694 stop:2497 length:804 start_codon:yes stop_codon:yes gene_type:complete